MNRLAYYTLLLLLTVTSNAALVCAESYRIRSQYRQGESGNWANDTNWHFESDDSHRFHVRMNDDPEPAFVLTYSQQNRLQQVIHKGSNNTDKTDRIIARASEGRIVLSHGFPLPFDDLDPWDLTDGDVQIKKEAGGVRFVQTVRRQSEPFSLEAAIAAGMVSPGFAQTFEGTALTMISVIKDGRPMIRQLWVAGERWWRYEETKFRRSWRINDS